MYRCLLNNNAMQENYRSILLFEVKIVTERVIFSYF